MAAKKNVATVKAQKITPAGKARTKGEIYNAIAGASCLSRKQVVSVFEALGTLLAADLGKKGPGIVQVPGLMKVTVKRIAAKPARKGVNPFTGEEQMFKAKPARNAVKVRPMKALKSMV